MNASLLRGRLQVRILPGSPATQRESDFGFGFTAQPRWRAYFVHAVLAILFAVHTLLLVQSP